MHVVTGKKLHVWIQWKRTDTDVKLALLRNVITERKAVSAWWERCTGRPALKNMMDADRAAMTAARK